MVRSKLCTVLLVLQSGSEARLGPIPPKEKSLLRRGLGGKQKTGEVVGIYAYSAPSRAWRE